MCGLPECLHRMCGINALRKIHHKKKKKNSSYSLDECHTLVNIYLKKMFSPRIPIEQPSSQPWGSGGGREEWGEENIRIHSRRLGRNKQERLIRTIAKEGERFKDDRQLAGSRNSRLIFSAGPGQLNCQEEVIKWRNGSWMPLTRKEDWGFFKPDQSWKCMAPKVGINWGSPQMRCLGPEAPVRKYSWLQTRGVYRDQILPFPLFPGGLSSKLPSLALSEQRHAVRKGSHAIGMCNREISALRFRKTCCLQHLNEEWQYAPACSGGSSRRDRQERWTTAFLVLTLWRICTL